MNPLLLGPLVGLLSSAAPPGKPPVSLEAETAAFHAARLERLRGESGWLTLVGLSWLEEGGNAAGSAPGAKVVLPAGAPAAVGTFTRAGRAVSFAPASGVGVTLGGKPFSGGALKTDAGGAPDVLRVGSLQLLVIERGERLGVRVRDSEAAARRAFQGIDRFAVSASWRKEALFEPAPQGQTLSVPNVLGDVSPEPLAGTLVFTHEGKTHRLLATKEDDGLFVVFGDLTNRNDSYGAGRFLSTELPKEGRVVLDFNRATNPPCAFSAFATCPLPVKENRLPLRVEAGEKRVAHHP